MPAVAEGTPEDEVDTSVELTLLRHIEGSKQKRNGHKKGKSAHSSRVKPAIKSSESANGSGVLFAMDDSSSVH